MAKDKAQERIEQLETELKNLTAARRLRTEQITALETEQRKHIVGARVSKNAQAQGNIDRLSIEIAKLRTEDAWDCAAIEEMSTSLAEEKAALGRALWQTRCATVNRLLKSRSKGVLEQRLLDLALQLRQTVAEIAGSDKEIANTLRDLHPSLLRDVNEFPYRDRWRRAALSYLLRDAVDTPVCQEPMYTARMQELAVESFELLMRHVNEVAEIEPAVKAA
jgi:hypothetical protein